MPAANLNTIRSTIEGRLATELAASPVLPVVISNVTHQVIQVTTIEQDNEAITYELILRA